MKPLMWIIMMPISILILLMFSMLVYYTYSIIHIQHSANLNKLNSYLWSW